MNPPPSILIRTCVNRKGDRRKKNAALIQASFNLGRPARIRLGQLLYGTKNKHHELIPSYSVCCMNTAAVRYFHKRLAELMAELDGTVVIEDPPGTSGAV